MQVTNMFTLNFIVCPSKADAGRFNNISCNTNEPKPHKHVANYRGVKLPGETCERNPKFCIARFDKPIFHPGVVFEGKTF